jgi:hypothetical protein
MKVILAQPSIPRFQWELEVLLTNIRQFTDMEVVLLFSKPHDYNSAVPPYLVHKYMGVRAFVYEDRRFDKSYIPAIRPYLWWQYLSKDPARERESYFYIDSDVIFREWPKVSQLSVDAKHWAGSDCGSYIDYNYIKQCERGPEIIERMARICNITPQQMIGVPGIGAHLVIAQPTAEMWEKAYNRSLTIWHYFDGVHSNIQKWTAEMWAQLWTMVEAGITLTAPKELDFCMSTDPIEKWDRVKILHNSGVTEDTGKLFFKGKYQSSVPFGEDFSWVDQTKCSHRYVDAIERVLI